MKHLTSGYLGLLTLKDKLKYFSIAFIHKSIQAFFSVLQKYLSNVLPFTEPHLLSQLRPQVNVADAVDIKTPRKRMERLNADMANLPGRSVPAGEGTSVP